MLEQKFSHETEKELDRRSYVEFVHHVYYSHFRHTELVCRFSDY